MVRNTKIIEWEIESGLEKVGIDVEKTDVHLLGKGIEFAFGVSKEKVRSDFEDEMINRSVLTGSDMFNMEPIYSGSFAEQRISFFNHLKELQVKKKCFLNPNGMIGCTPLQWST